MSCGSSRRGGGATRAGPDQRRLGTRADAAAAWSALSAGASYWLLLAAALVIGALAQLLLVQHHLYHVSNDESARALIAADLTWQNALVPWIWPPFYKIFIGSLLHLHPDIFWVPRIAVFITGLLTIVSLVYLARGMFRDPVVDLATAFLSMLIWHRLLLSVAPMADIFFFLFISTSAALAIRWLISDDQRYLIATSLSLFLASTVRYEGCFFALLLLVYLAYRMAVARDVSWPGGSVAAFFLIIFPVGWLALSFYHHGSLAGLRITSEQYVDAHGYDYGRALQYNMVTYFVYDLLTNPLLIFGALGAAGFAIRSRRSLLWTAIWFLPLPLVAITGILSLGLPDAARWRMSGAWTLLWLPFAASGLVMFVARVVPARWRMAVLGALVAVAAVAFLPRDASLIRQYLDPPSVQAGRFVQDLPRDGEKILIDTRDNLAYLDVLVASNSPQSFVTTALADPVEIALFLPGSATYYRENREDIIDAYLRDHFSLATSPDLEKMHAHGIRYLLVLHPKSTARLRASGYFVEMRPFGDWTLFAMR